MEKPLRIIAPVGIRGRVWGGRGYICLNDIAQLAERQLRIADWLRNNTTLEHLAAWESSHNPAFNGGEFAPIRDRYKKGNGHRLSVFQWVETTNAVGLRIVYGRHGGTYAVLDIAMHFARWVKPMPFYPLRVGPVFRNNLRDIQYAIRILEDYLVTLS